VLSGSAFIDQFVNVINDHKVSDVYSRRVWLLLHA